MRPITDHTSHRVYLAPLEALEDRRLNAISGISGSAILGDPPARLGGAQMVTVTGTVDTDAPIGTTANALLFDEYAPGVPIVFPVTLTSEDDGTYTYSIPLSLSTKVRNGDRDGHQYAVAISVQDKTGSATTSTTFSLPGVRTPATRVAPRFLKAGRGSRA